VGEGRPPGGGVCAKAPKARRTVALALGAVALVGLAGAGAGAAAAPAAAATRTPATSASKTVWLCRPGQADDPCTADLASTSVSANGSTETEAASPATSSKFDCFYVYPTVSGQTTPNANLEVEPVETVTAEAQASRFSQVCQVWAPMYRQRTASSLLQNQIDPSPRLRKLMVSAILLGGNVTVPIGKTVGGSFRHLPLCSSAAETGCVIAYSSFGKAPPSDTFFGRPGTGVSDLSDQTASAGLQVACVNPVTFSTAPGPLLPYFFSTNDPVPGVHVGTPWISFPGLYTARCETIGGATTLQVIPTGVPGDPRPLVAATLGATWGYHDYDVNLALGNLVADVAREEGATQQ
jgi:hypothetical protein